MKNRGTAILNYSMVILYSAGLTALAALVEILLDAAGIATPDALLQIGQGLAETGFSVTVIAVSILTVITNMSEKRYFGIKAGEYLKFRRKRFEPGFYDNLVVIIIIGAMQYAALALQAQFAATLMFVEIIVLMVVQIRWGLGIAFFYYGKEKEIRAFFLDEINGNLATVAEEAAGGSKTRKGERAAQVVGARIDQLFAHTKNAASVRESTELVQNLGMLVHVFKALLQPGCHSVWRNYETRFDYLLASLLSDEEQREYAVAALSSVLDIVIETMDDAQTGDGIAKNCDFDNSRNTAYKMLTYADPKTLASMFEKRLFYKMEVVKIFGIENKARKAARYRYYSEQFASSAAASPYASEILEMTAACLVWLAPMAFTDGRVQEAGYYACIMIEALNEAGISTADIGGMLNDKYFGNAENADGSDEKKQRSVYIMMLIEKQALGLSALPDIPQLVEEDKAAACDMAGLLGKELPGLACERPEK